MSACPASLGARALVEVETCHAFFVDWYAGRLGGGPALAARLAAFSPAFRRIAPDGRIVDYAELATFLGARRADEETTGFAIRIEDGRVLWESADAALISYVERQFSRQGENRRRSRALFVAAPEAPTGVVWLHLQETTIDPTCVDGISSR